MKKIMIALTLALVSLSTTVFGQETESTTDQQLIRDETPMVLPNFQAGYGWLEWYYDSTTGGTTYEVLSSIEMNRWGFAKSNCGTIRGARMYFEVSPIAAQDRILLRALRGRTGKVVAIIVPYGDGWVIESLDPGAKITVNGKSYSEGSSIPWIFEGAVVSQKVDIDLAEDADSMEFSILKIAHPSKTRIYVEGMKPGRKTATRDN